MAEGLREQMFAGLTACSPQARQVVDALLQLGGDGEDSVHPGAGAVMADDMVLLARAMHVLEAETGRLAAAADRADATRTGVTSELRAAGWSAGRAAALLSAGRLARDHDGLTDLWRAGQVSAPQLTTIAAGSTVLTTQQRCALVNTLLPFLSAMGTRGTRACVDAAVDALAPQQAAARERFAHDRRYLTWSRYRDHVLLDARLPALEGEALLSVLHGYSEKLRAEGDGLTKSQRNADALAALVAGAAADGRVPTAGGLPAAATITIPLAEADRLTGHPHEPGCGGSSETVLPIRPNGRIGDHHTLGRAAGRFLMCCSELTGVVVSHPGGANPLGALLGQAREEPLAVGRAQRFATIHQRKALAVRDKGCVIPGCGIPAGHCQPHHVTDWAAGGSTDLDQLALLCWAHHRQVELHRWRLAPADSPDVRHWQVIPTARHTWLRRRQ